MTYKPNSTIANLWQKIMINCKFLPIGVALFDWLGTNLELYTAKWLVAPSNALSNFVVISLLLFLYPKNKWKNCPQNQEKSQACSKVSAAKCWNFLGVPFWGAHEGARRYGGGARRERDRYYIIAEKGFFQGRGDVSSFLKLPFLFTSWESFWNRTPRKDPHQ